jgi:sucrose-6-phosphate hydrolase SacC (GH32 family)
MYDYSTPGAFQDAQTFKISNARVMLGYSPEESLSSREDWSGVLTFPRIVDTSRVGDTGILYFQPYPGIEKLRDTSDGHALHIYNLSLTQDSLPPSYDISSLFSAPPETHKRGRVLSEVSNGIRTLVTPLEGLYSPQLDLDLKVKVNIPYYYYSPAGGVYNQKCRQIEFGLRARSSNDFTTNFTDVGIMLSFDGSGTDKYLYTSYSIYTVLDTTESGERDLGGNRAKGRQEIPMKPAINYLYTKDGNMEATFSLRTIWDHSLTEIFALDGASVSTLRLYPSKYDDNIGLYVKLFSACENFDVLFQEVHGYSLYL